MTSPFDYSGNIDLLLTSCCPKLLWRCSLIFIFCCFPQVGDIRMHTHSHTCTCYSTDQHEFGVSERAGGLGGLLTFPYKGIFANAVWWWFIFWPTLVLKPFSAFSLKRLLHLAVTSDSFPCSTAACPGLCKECVVAVGYEEGQWGGACASW